MQRQDLWRMLSRGRIPRARTGMEALATATRRWDLLARWGR